MRRLLSKRNRNLRKKSKMTGLWLTMSLHNVRTARPPKILNKTQSNRSQILKPKRSRDRILNDGVHGNKFNSNQFLHNQFRVNYSYFYYISKIII